MAIVYEQVAAGHHCSVMIAADRLEEVRAHWMRDTDRIEIDGDSTPDHFKQAGFLCYWLRRRQTVSLSSRKIISEQHQQIQDLYLMNGNEITAFLVAFRLAAYFEFKDQIDSVENIEQEISGLHLSHAFVSDIAVLMKNKNLSPHALYITLRGLFYNLSAPRRLKTAEIHSIN